MGDDAARKVNEQKFAPEHDPAGGQDRPIVERVLALLREHGIACTAILHEPAQRP